MGMLALAWERGSGCALEGPAHSATSEYLKATNPAITEVDTAEDGQQVSLAVGDNTTVTYRDLCTSVRPGRSGPASSRPSGRRWLPWRPAAGPSCSGTRQASPLLNGPESVRRPDWLRTDVPGASFMNLTSRGHVRKKQMHPVGILIVPAARGHFVPGQQQPWKNCGRS